MASAAGEALSLGVAVEVGDPGVSQERVVGLHVRSLSGAGHRSCAVVADVVARVSAEAEREEVECDQRSDGDQQHEEWIHVECPCGMGSMLKNDAQLVLM